jgi:hypothetical protein
LKGEGKSSSELARVIGLKAIERSGSFGEIMRLGRALKNGDIDS